MSSLNVTFPASIKKNFTRSLNLTQIVDETTDLIPSMIISIGVAIFAIILAICFYYTRRSSQNRRGNYFKLTDTLLGPKFQPKVQTLGKLRLKLHYDLIQNSLSVTVIEAADFPILDIGDICNPFVTISLIPDNNEMFKTKMDGNTVHPFFNQIIICEILMFVIINLHLFAKHDAIVKVKVPLSEELVSTIVK